MAKKSIYSLDGLLIKKKSLEVIKVINILKIFSGLRFFKIDYYPFDYKKFVKFFNELIIYSIYHNYITFVKGIVIFFIKILNKNIFIKKKLFFEMSEFLKWYKKKIIKIFKKFYLKNYKIFNKAKFRFIKLKKVYYLRKHKFGPRTISDSGVKKSKEQLLEENIKMKFFSTLVKNKKNLKVIHHYLKQRFKKSFKKKIRYFNKQKNNTSDNLRKNFSDYIVYNKIRKKKTKRILYTKLRLKFKGNFAEQKESANNFKNILYLDKSEKKIKWLLKKRKRKFLRKSVLIKRFKRIIFRKKKRTAILHFRMYSSNYYITLTDLFHNVIFSCSAGSVSDTNNKKTKMSYVVSMPIFFRILFFLRSFKIRNLKFVFRNRMDKIFFNAIHFFKKRGYKIKSFSFVQKRPHHLGQRKQKPRRI